MKRLLCVLAFSVLGASACAAVPNCAGVNSWPASMAFVHLKNAGMLTSENTDFDKTQVSLVASQPEKAGLYIQVHQVKFQKRDGSVVQVITVNQASNQECSESPVEVFVVSERLGGE